jgi:energy-coupling factor transporter ATP-binding protein EcfA2
LFQHAISEMRSTVKRSPIRGYVITPSVTQIEAYHLDSLNLQHVSGTLADFATWLETEIPKPPTTWELATARRPELRHISDKLSDAQKRALNSVTVVSPTTIPLSKKASTGTIREFYKGYKPSWGDIVDEVPASLESFNSFSSVVLDNHNGKTCIALVGPAGSGKTTALMTTALYISRTTRLPVYFLREAVSDIKNVIISLEQINSGGFYLFIDKIDPMAREVYEVLSSTSAKNICIVFSERQNIWSRRVKAALDFVTPTVHAIGRVTKADVKAILNKLQTFGPWTRLEAMTSSQRQAEMFQKADRQLLIGMLEATTGLGFIEIIKNDFSHLGSVEHQQVLVGLSITHRSSLSAQIVGSSLINLGISQDVNAMTRETEGIVISNDRRYSARHPVYVRELFEKVTPPKMVRDCLVALLEAFSDYQTPVVKHVSKADGIVFKSVINHRFVREILRGDESLALSVYENFETKFHVDGLYWLQYGLALRGFGKNTDAFDKFKTARSAYHSPQIEHAYAQQLLIIASRACTWEDAEPMLTEAIGVLKELESGADPLDTYPIVTLAEGHISVLLKFFGIEGAKAVAQQYANELLIASRRVSTPRLQEAVEKIVGLAERGAWSEAYGPDPA